MASRNRRSGIHGGAGARHAEPMHRVRRAEVQHPAIRRHAQERMPDFDVARVGAHSGVPRDARHHRPARRAPALGRVRASAAARRGENIAIGQGDGRVVPPPAVHVLHPCPGVGPPVEHAREGRFVAPAVHHDAPVRHERDAAAEHVVCAVIELLELPRRRIPRRRVGELDARGKGRPLVRGEGEEASVRQVRRGHRDVRCPRDHAAPRAGIDAVRGINRGCRPASHEGGPHVRLAGQLSSGERQLIVRSMAVRGAPEMGGQNDERRNGCGSPEQVGRDSAGHGSVFSMRVSST